MRKYAVIGMGSFGFHVAKTLYEAGNAVIAIDIDRNLIQAIDPYCTEAIVQDATDKETMISLGLNTMDAVIIAVGAKISTSVLICLHLQEIGVKRIVAKAMDQDHEIILKRVGATEVIHPEKEMAVRVARSLSTPNLLDFIPLAKDYELVQIEPPREFINKSLSTLNLRAKYKVFIIAIKEPLNENFILVPSANQIIKKDDILLMLGKTEDIMKIEDLK